MKKLAEKDILKAISDYLAAIGIIHWRQNSGAVINTYKRKERFFRLAYWMYPKSTEIERYAFLDIAGITSKGRFFSIEVKTKGKYPTKGQQNTIDMINRIGGLAFVARSVDDVMDKIF